MPRQNGFRFPREMIPWAVRAYHRIALSTADVEDLLAERGVVVSRESIRRWINRFGAHFAACNQRNSPIPADKWHLDELVVPIKRSEVLALESGPRCCPVDVYEIDRYLFAECERSFAPAWRPRFIRYGGEIFYARKREFVSMMRTILTLACLSLACAGSAQDLPQRETISDCFVEVPDSIAPNSGVECGYVRVPQNRSGAPNGVIELPYMQIRATREAGSPPLFILAGGPGQTLITDDEMALLQPEFLGSLFAGRDVVLMEQRGSFLAKPKLTCPEVGPLAFQALQDGLDPAAMDSLGHDTMQTCIDGLAAAGVDFATYNNVESAADVNDVRAALGYEKIVLYGSSYATLLNQFVMRQFPDILAAVVLDGTESPTTRSWVENRAKRAEWGLARMSRLCNGQPTCAAAFDIPELVEKAFETLGESPVAITLSLPESAPSAGKVRVMVGPDDLASFIYGLQTSKYGVGGLPMFLTEQVAAGRDALATLLATQVVSNAIASISGDESGMVTLMHIAMVCSDDPAKSLDEVEIDGSDRYATAFGLAEAREYVTLCNIMDVPELPESSDALVGTDVPVLVLSGGLDVQTPSFLADEVVASLPNATHVIFPSGFHVQVANLNRCAIAILTAFVDDPHEDLDTRCREEMGDVQFLIPEDETTTKQ